MERKLIAQVIALLVVISAVSFGAGYMLAGGPERATEEHYIGENITVNVSVPDEDGYTSLDMLSGMTVLDAAARVIEIKTELYDFGPAILTTDGDWLLYTVDGEDPGVGMDKYQLSGGENIDFSLA